MTPKQFQNAILKWFHKHGRKDLPWQQGITPYRVWVSEIMLQQTQVSAVVPYFARFMNSFPTLEALAHAPLEQVLAHWSGLGYYARARNLHKCAQTVMDQYDGEFPRSLEALTGLSGIGRSTAGAIASISMGLKAPILDGNVKRVLARCHAVEGWPGRTAVANKLWQLAETYTPDTQGNLYTQAIMDLGATLCTRSKPSCRDCPLKKCCQAHAQGNPQEYPHKKPHQQKPTRSATMLLLEYAGEIYLEQRPTKGIWGGLWCPPQSDSTQSWLKQRRWRAGKIQPLPPLRHTFTHFHLDISPVWVQLARAPAQVAKCGAGWYKLRSLNRPRAAQEVGLPAPIVKLAKQLLALQAPLLTPTTAD
ncbi:A/G-specific adenine glycosylase [Microbulbifer sp. 2304DJ12-6]|uniref:A/G-specific adenine glycosylase n=1 Tax=Microbulbifer sp. 2304DJ12-6 TaxID=3233340 RepID=UPI0039B03409